MKKIYVMEDIDNYGLIEDVLKTNEIIDNEEKENSEFYYNDDNVICTIDKGAYNFYNDLADAYYTIQYVEDNIDNLIFNSDRRREILYMVDYYLNKQGELEQIIVFARELKENLNLNI